VRRDAWPRLNVRVEVQGPFATVTGGPVPRSLNALDTRTLQELEKAGRRTSRARGTASAASSSPEREEKAFVAGADIAEMNWDDADQRPALRRARVSG
jgi:enoyl-CoA hydratase/carnithine racemase